MRDLVHALEEFDGVEIFAAAVLIGNPLAFLARIIEIQHGSDGIDAESVDVKLVQPEERVGDEEVLDFVAAIVVNESAPVGGALARVGVLVEMGAVELGEAVGVAREVRGSPVQNDADAGLVAAVDELHEFRGGSRSGWLRRSSRAFDSPRSRRKGAP